MKDIDEKDKQNLQRIVNKSAPLIVQSGIFASLLSKGWHKDPVPVLQLGLAMLLDKPIVIIALDDEPVPENIRKVAIAVERANTKDPESIERAARIVLDKAAAFIEGNNNE